MRAHLKLLCRELKSASPADIKKFECTMMEKQQKLPSDQCNKFLEPGNVEAVIVDTKYH